MSKNTSQTGENSYHPKKGEVCYVPWRKGNWPALVKNSYPKKITYVFFPLNREGKTTSFTLCNPKKCQRLSSQDEPPANEDFTYSDALAAAKEYIFNCGQELGWECNSVDPLPFITNGIRRPTAHNPDISNDSSRDGDEEDSVTNTDDSEKPENHETSVDQSDKDENNQPDSSEPKAKKMRYSSKKTRLPSGHINTNDTEETRPTKQPAAYASGKSLKKNYNHAMPMCNIMFENIDKFLKQVWEAGKVRNYKVPSRGDILLKLPYAKILNENDTDLLFEHCLNFVRVNEPECRTLPAVDLVSRVLFPEIILLAVMEDRNISYDEAVKYMISYTGNPEEGFKNDPSAETPLHILVDAAAMVGVKQEDQQP